MRIIELFHRLFEDVPEARDVPADGPSVLIDELPEAFAGVQVPISYWVVSREPDRLRSEFCYSTDSGVTWRRATVQAATDQGATDIAISLPGRHHIINWNARRDLRRGKCDAIFRVSVIDTLTYAAASAITPTFTVDARSRNPIIIAIRWTSAALSASLRTIRMYAIILLTAVSIILAYEANEILTRQDEILSSQNAPVFHVFTQEARHMSTHGVSEKLTIENIGGPITNFRSSYAAFFRVTYGKGYIYKQHTLLVPVLDYYNTTIPTGNIRGRLITYLPLKARTGNYAKIVQITRQFYESARKIGFCGCALLQEYVSIQYENALGESHQEYYFVDVDGAEKLTDRDGSRIFSDYYSRMSIAQNRSFRTLTAGALYRAWKQLGMVANDTFALQWGPQFCI